MFFTRKQKVVIWSFVALIIFGFGWMISVTAQEMSVGKATTTTVVVVVVVSRRLLSKDPSTTTTTPTTTTTAPPPPPPPPTLAPPTTVYRPAPTVPRTTIVYTPPPPPSPTSGLNQDYLLGLQQGWDDSTPDGRAGLCDAYHGWMNGESWAYPVMDKFTHLDEALYFFSTRC